MEKKHNQVVNHGIIAEFISASSTQAVKKTTRVEDPETSSGIISFRNARAFTLIELLVVVLIIGILAAIAVPQYTKAVRKARIAEAKVLLKSLSDAADMFYLANGTDVEWSKENLDIDVPSDTKNWTISFDECLCGEINRSTCGCVSLAEPKWESGYAIRYHSPNYDGGPEEDDMAGKFICDSDIINGNEEICKGLGTQIQEGFYEL